MRARNNLGTYAVMLGIACSIIFVHPLWAAPDILKIGGVYSLTGPDSSVGKQVETGYTMAIEEINKAGGVYVKELNKKIPLELLALDMETNPEKAVSRTETLLSKHKVKAFVGTTFFAAAVNSLERTKTPAVVVASAGQRLHDRGYKYWFTPLGTSPDISRSVFDLFAALPESNRPVQFVIFEEQTDWGIEMSGYWKKELEQRGYKLASVQKYTMLTRDFSPQIMASKKAGGEIVLANPIMPDGMAMMRQMKQLDYNPKAVVMIRAPDDIPWTRATGKIGDYVVFSPGWHHSLAFTGIPELNAKHQAKFGRPTDVMAGPAYASIRIIADAVERAGSLETQKIRNAIVATDMMTVVGPVKFRPDGTNELAFGPVLQWQAGNQELIFPKDVMTKAFLYPMPPWSGR